MSVVLPPPADGFDVRAPVVIVGAGAAGLTAALAALTAGTEVVILERDAIPRGSTALSAGLIPAAGTHWQQAAGLADSPRRFAADILAKAEGQTDAAAVDLLTTAIAPVLEWLAHRHGLAFSLVDDFDYPGHSVRRMHGLASRSGEELMDRLREAAVLAGAEIVTGAHVTALFADVDGRAQGLRIARPDGNIELIGCDALVLASSGYGGNAALVRQHVPQLAGALYFGHAGNQGDALVWGQALGAATRHLGGHQGHGSVAHPHGILITYATITEGGFQVNIRGRRFSNEAKGYSEQAAAVLAEPESTAFSIFDARIAAIARQFKDFQLAEAAGAVRSAQTIVELAAAVGVPAHALAGTVREVEALKGGSGRDAFGRNFGGRALLAAPYCAVQVTGALFHTQGGLVVDRDARVQCKVGGVLPNVFAAGGAAVGVSGPHASGYLSGNGLLTAVGYGYLAGRAASVLVGLPRSTPE